MYVYIYVYIYNYVYIPIDWCLHPKISVAENPKSYRCPHCSLSFLPTSPILQMNTLHNPVLYCVVENRIPFMDCDTPQYYWWVLSPNQSPSPGFCPAAAQTMSPLYSHERSPFDHHSSMNFPQRSFPLKASHGAPSVYDQLKSNICGWKFTNVNPGLVNHGIWIGGGTPPIVIIRYSNGTPQPPNQTSCEFTNPGLTLRILNITQRLGYNLQQIFEGDVQNPKNGHLPTPDICGWKFPIETGRPPSHHFPILSHALSAALCATTPRPAAETNACCHWLLRAQASQAEAKEISLPEKMVGEWDPLW